MVSILSEELGHLMNVTNLSMWFKEENTLKWEIYLVINAVPRQNNPGTQIKVINPQDIVYVANPRGEGNSRNNSWLQLNHLFI